MQSFGMELEQIIEGGVERFVLGFLILAKDVLLGTELTSYSKNWGDRATDTPFLIFDWPG